MTMRALLDSDEEACSFPSWLFDAVFRLAVTLLNMGLIGVIRPFPA
jgi:hypothetical protein